MRFHPKCCDRQLHLETLFKLPIHEFPPGRHTKRDILARICKFLMAADSKLGILLGALLKFVLGNIIR